MQGYDLHPQPGFKPGRHSSFLQGIYSFTVALLPWQRPWSEVEEIVLSVSSRKHFEILLTNTNIRLSLPNYTMPIIQFMDFFPTNILQNIYRKNRESGKICNNKSRKKTQQQDYSRPPRKNPISHRLCQELRMLKLPARYFICNPPGIGNSKQNIRS